MKTIVALAVLLAACQTAIAQNAECRTISESAQRLACYDKLSPPTAASPTAASVTPVTSKAKASTFVDPTVGDDRMLDTRLKGICRGC